MGTVGVSFNAQAPPSQTFVLKVDLLQPFMLCFARLPAQDEVHRLRQEVAWLQQSNDRLVYVNKQMQTELEQLNVQAYERLMDRVWTKYIYLYKGPGAASKCRTHDRQKMKMAPLATWHASPRSHAGTIHIAQPLPMCV